MTRNLYTAYVDADALSFMLILKFESIRCYFGGIPPREMLPKLGYSIEIIGKSRLNGVPQKILDGGSFREVMHNKTGPLFDASEEQVVLTDRRMINPL